MFQIKFFIVTSLLLLFISCQEATVSLPFSIEEVQDLAAQIRMNPIKPHNHILSLFEENSVVELVDYPGFTGVVDLLEYLMPLLYDRGIFEYDLWFIPQDGLTQANAILKASRFFSPSAADLIGRVSFLYQYQEYVDFLEAIYNFNKTLPAGSTPVTLVNSSSSISNAVLMLSRDVPRTSENPVLYIQSPPLLQSLKQSGPTTSLQRINQISSSLEGGENLYVIINELQEILVDDDITLIMLAKPGTLKLCTPVEEGINIENALIALKDFPEINVSVPWVSVPLMKRAQRRLLRNYVIPQTLVQEM